jgi:hypothetical protein
VDESPNVLLGEEGVKEFARRQIWKASSLVNTPEHRFPEREKSAILGALYEAAPMQKSKFANQQVDGSSADQGTKLRLSDYFWRPWYAKLWWSCSIFLGVVAIFATEIFSREWLQANDGWITIVSLVFHPFTIVPVLGFPAVWAWRRSVVFPWDPGYEDESDDIEEDLYGGESIGFGRRLKGADLSDPTDPASPFNSANPLYRLHNSEL